MISLPLGVAHLYLTNSTHVAGWVTEEEKRKKERKDRKKGRRGS